MGKKSSKAVALDKVAVMGYDIEAFLSAKDVEAWKQVGGAIVERRTQLDMSQAQLAKEARLSIQTVSRLELAHNTKIRRATAYIIEQTLGWELGSIERLLFDGDEPVLSEAGAELVQESASIRELRNDVDDLKVEFAELKDLVENFFDALNQVRPR